MISQEASLAPALQEQEAGPGLYWTRHKRTHTDARAHTRAHARTHARTHARARAHTHTHKHRANSEPCIQGASCKARRMKRTSKVVHACKGCKLTGVLGSPKIIGAPTILIHVRWRLPQNPIRVTRKQRQLEVSDRFCWVVGCSAPRCEITVEKANIRLSPQKRSDPSDRIGIFPPSPTAAQPPSTKPDKVPVA